MIRVTERRANGGRRVNARIGCEERSRVFLCLLHHQEHWIRMLMIHGSSDSLILETSLTH